MASGHEKCRINRPDTWQLRPSSAKQIKSLDNTEPSTHGTKLSNWARLDVVRSTPELGPYGRERLVSPTFAPSIGIAANANF